MVSSAGEAFEEMAAAEWARRESQRANERTGYGMINSLYGASWAVDGVAVAMRCSAVAHAGVCRSGTFVRPFAYGSHVERQGTAILEIRT